MTDKNIFKVLSLLNKTPFTEKEAFENLEGISWENFLKIITHLVKNDHLERDEEDIKLQLTKNGKLYLNELEIELLNKEKDKQAESKKIRNEATLSTWKVKTFWPAFLIAFLGGLYSIYDSFIKTPKILKDVQELQLSKEQMELELSKLQTSISDQKNQDSLSPTNFESSK